MNKESYALGLSVGANILSATGGEVVFEDFIAGIQCLFEKREPEMSTEEVQATLSKYFEELQSKVKNQNQEQGKKFLEENAKREGVVTLENGLQYEILKEGDGEKPKKTDTVTVHYEGTLIDGAVFDSSYKRGEPASFPLTGVIAGWTEILQLMPVGSKWKVAIPSELAYGEQGAGQMIAPNATLVFDIELLGIEDKK